MLSPVLSALFLFAGKKNLFLIDKLDQKVFSDQVD